MRDELKRAALLFAFGLLAATAVSAGESQRLNSGPPPRYSDSKSGFWGSFRPAPSEPQLQAPAARRPPTTNIAEPAAVRSNIAQPEAARAETEQPKAQETPRKRKAAERPAKKKSATARSGTRSKSKAAKARKPAEPKTAKEEVAEASPEPVPDAGRSKFFTGAEARWWEETGNPAVFAFSGCVGRFAEASVRQHVELPHAEYVTQAMAGPCKGEFDAMAGLILKRHGEKGFASVSRELIDTTFIPAVRDAIARAAADLRNEEKRKAMLAAELSQAKSDMFSCFVREADQRASASAQAPQAIAEAVIETCGPAAQRFFAKLDELYPDTSADERRTQQSALRESYLPAILSRVASIRAGASVSAQQ